MKVQTVIYLCVIFYPIVFAKSVKIIGGTVADIREFPYMASFRYPNGVLFCAGTIISNRHILTAAHCFEFSNTFDEMKICTGTSELKNCSGTLHKPKHIEIHPEFTGEMSETSKVHHDLAVVTVNKCIKFNEVQNKINLPTIDVLPGANAVFSGWGKTSYPMFDLSAELRKASTKILSNSECSNIQEFSVHAEQICAYEKDGVGACDGDSGGPLIV
ncbi:PREDICTED: transmembrane protease serine 11B-like protein [Ceratosolen solmsi marchali]|uniref:Transmembrane protease serine 11B-like protein n=1 Tax=Ceratosolen solmsi marchali TaxID=326594 RepID=A0AAJ7E2S6_9HYME|nr:PREDICTED: transmembrane protease serine 11B-like protein [Ceratosolen solmsi marchali]